jgi:cyclopropane fatty-acyl-phospholipid synthase-like methyltransferase
VAAATLAEMTDPAPPKFDFEALYRGESPAEGMPAFPAPPWDTKAPKENVIAWQEAGLVHGEVLDVGCGYGDNAVYLAKRGFSVTGVDISPTALVTAGQRAADAGVAVRFTVADATTLAGYTDAFDTVIDSGMYHGLDDDDKRRYLAAAHRATRPGATLLLTAFTDANAEGRAWPRPMVSERTLRDTLGEAGWDITSLTTATTHLTHEGTDAAFWMLQARRHD